MNHSKTKQVHGKNNYAFSSLSCLKIFLAYFMYNSCPRNVSFSAEDAVAHVLINCPGATLVWFRVPLCIFFTIRLSISVKIIKFVICKSIQNRPFLHLDAFKIWFYPSALNHVSSFLLPPLASSRSASSLHIESFTYASKICMNQTTFKPLLLGFDWFLWVFVLVISAEKYSAHLFLC